MDFEQKAKYFRHPNCPWIVEFVSPPVAVGDEPVYKYAKMKTKMGTIKMLRPTDSVKDRLASFYHWNDRQCLEQAVDICLEVPRIDFKELTLVSNRGLHAKISGVSCIFSSKKSLRTQLVPTGQASGGPILLAHCC